MPGIITAWNSGTLTATICPNPTYPTSGNFTPTCTGSEPALTGVTINTGPIQASFSNALTTNLTLNATYTVVRGYGTAFKMNGGATTAFTQYDYARLISPPSNHTQFDVWEPTPGVGSPITASMDQNFNVSFYDKLSANNTGTGDMTLFGNGSGAADQVTFTHVHNNFNVLASNTCTGMGAGWGSGTGCSSNNTNSYSIRLVNQTSGGGATVHYTLASGILTIISVDSGGPLIVGSTIICSTCTNTIRITAFGGSGCAGTCTGTGGTGTYPVVNTTDTVSSSTSATAAPYQGIMNFYQAIGNLLDDTGNNGDNFSIPYWDFWVQSSDFTSVQNTNMLNGNACTPSSC